MPFGGTGRELNALKNRLPRRKTKNLSPADSEIEPPRTSFHTASVLGLVLRVKHLCWACLFEGWDPQPGATVFLNGSPLKPHKKGAPINQKKQCEPGPKMLQMVPMR